jgi:UDP-2,3-diacylglucosamine hydrolase
MGTFFEETLKARVFSGPAIVDLDGKKVFLCHGDQINRADYGYRLLRSILHNRMTRSVIPLVPPVVASYIAEWMARGSRENHQARRIRWDFTAMIRDFAASRFKEGNDAVVLGHFHLPLFEQTANGKTRTLLSLGDWINHYSYGEWNNGEFSLKTYRKK